MEKKPPETPQSPKGEFCRKPTVHLFWMFFFVGVMVFIAQKPAPVTYTIIGVGDIMLGTNYPGPQYLAPQDGKNLLEPVKTILQNADVTFGNLEGVLLDAGGTVKKCSNPALCFAFRSPVRYAAYLKDAGFDMLSVANNHSGDFGQEGRNSTAKTLDSHEIKYSGFFNAPSAVFEKDGVKYGLIAFAPNPPGTLDLNDLAGAEKLVREMDKKVDILIVSFHGGAEGTNRQHVTRKSEFFVGENRGNVYTFAHRMIDAGADVLFGHGPHVTRSVDLYKDRFIVYSLGNFATYGRFSLFGEGGVAPVIKVSVNRQGEFQEAEITPVVQLGQGGPQIDPQKKVIRTLQNLLKSDFPEVPLRITNEGLISRK
jgi:poly-gamma-glutamate capsule biosynthesis protein CapA/YwtB (metallophosphatase superfamily)